MNKALKECLDILSPLVITKKDDNILAVIKAVRLPLPTDKPKTEDITMLHFDLTKKGIKIKEGFILEGYSFLPHNPKEIVYAWIESHATLTQSQGKTIFQLAEVLLE